jgi:hypothetical protein
MIAHLFNKALKVGGDTHTVADVREGLLDGRFQIWRDPDDTAVVITEIHSYPRCKKLHVFIIAGAFDAIMRLQPQIIAFAKEQGCNGMTTTARRGFLKRLSRFGWKPSFITFTHDFEGQNVEQGRI